MKRKAMALLAAALMTMAVAAAGQELPSIACFSPGLLRMSEALGAGDGLSTTAQFTVSEALYARDLSLLSDMLAGTAFTYAGAPGYDSLTIARGGETLCDLALVSGEDGAVAMVNGEAYALDASQLDGEAAQAFAQADAFLLGTPILERAPLEAVAAWLGGLQAGDMLVAGFAVSEAFAIERTMSDDGTRLTRIDIDGAIARAGEAPWRVTGFLRQPAGKAPKDTFELVITQDEKNFFELSYSAQRSDEITRRDKAGKTSVRSTVKAAGKLEGYAVSVRLNVNATNEWKTEGEGAPLSEKVVLRTELGYTDRRPLSAKINADDLAASMRHELTLTTAEGDTGVTVNDAASIEVTTGGNDLLAGTMTLRASAGPNALDGLTIATPGEAAQGAQSATLSDVREALERAVRQISAAFYRQQSAVEGYFEDLAP